jgi:hypothetical protein
MPAKNVYLFQPELLAVRAWPPARTFKGASSDCYHRGYVYEYSEQGISGHPYLLFSVSLSRFLREKEWCDFGDQRRYLHLICKAKGG